MALVNSKLHKDPGDFFAWGNSTTLLTTDAAIAVCLQAAGRGLLVARVEGGIWHDPGYEYRLDCIWEGEDPPVPEREAHDNNMVAAEFIRRKSRELKYDVFVLTAPPISGWPHKRN